MIEKVLLKRLVRLVFWKEMDDFGITEESYVGKTYEHLSRKENGLTLEEL